MTVEIFVGNQKYKYEADRPCSFTEMMGQLGLPFLMSCSGKGICKNCKVFVEPASGRADSSSKEGTWELGCKLNLNKDCKITVPKRLVSDMKPMASDDSNKQEIKAHTAVVDLGTTTINMAFLDETGLEIGSRIRFSNPQSVVGADVVSRISYALDEDGASELFMLVRRALANEKRGASKVVVAGNTAMEHLLMGWPVDGLSAFPFNPYSLDFASDDEYVVLPGISAFVGADIMSGLYHLNILDKQKPTMLLDLGTNAEMALWTGNVCPDGGRLYVTSAAAGPALEGGNISCGMPALTGAIYKVDLMEGGALEVGTVGNVSPIGLCGSGLIDLVWALRKKGIIGATGLFYSDDMAESGYEIYPQVRLTAEDVQQLILAKSAIASGLMVLCEKARISLEDIDTFYIAGAMGKAMNVAHLAELGIIPKELKNVAKAVGNTSLEGAIDYCRAGGDNVNARTQMSEIKKRSIVVELANEKRFEELFLENLCI